MTPVRLLLDSPHATLTLSVARLGPAARRWFAGLGVTPCPGARGELTRRMVNVRPRDWERFVAMGLVLHAATLAGRPLAPSDGAGTYGYAICSDLLGAT